MSEYYDGSIFNDIHNAYEEGYSDGQRNATQWISVEDRLPSNSNRVLVYGVYRRLETKIVDILRYQGKNYGWEEQRIFTVTHWMPLPSPPSEMRGAE